MVLLTLDFTSLVMLSFSVPSTAVSLAAKLLLSWPATGSMLLEMPRDSTTMSKLQPQAAIAIQHPNQKRVKPPQGVAQLGCGTSFG